MFKTIILSSVKEFSQIENMLNDGGNLFIFSKNIYVQWKIERDIFDDLEFIVKKGYEYLNTIVYFDYKINDISYIHWFTNNVQKHFFNKDLIREKHIWKDVEWGKRTKNYSNLGKDPGNVWIFTKDDSKGKITEHILPNLDVILNKLIISTTNSEDTIFASALYESNLKNYNLNIEFSKLSDQKESCSHKKNTNFSFNLSKNKHKDKVFFKSSEKMDEIGTKSVQCIVTSPPYWDIKNYFKDGQIGREDYDKYLSRLNKVWGESYRILSDTGLMWINVNNISKKGKEILITKDIIESCKKIGFNLIDIYIWHKSSAIPTKPKKLSDHYEFILVFSKSEEFYLNLDKNFINDYKNELLANKHIWNLNRKAGSIGKKYSHPAIFPESLVERIIDLSTEENSTVCDPFLGSGTSLVVSLRKKRFFLGYEYNEGFEELIKSRLPNTQNVEFIKD